MNETDHNSDASNPAKPTATGGVLTSATCSALETELGKKIGEKQRLLRSLQAGSETEKIRANWISGSIDDAVKAQAYGTPAEKVVALASLNSLN